MILGNYESIVPDDPTVRATWEHERRVGNEKHAPADEDSNGDQSYATLSMASLSTILTTEDRLTSVTTTNTSFDLTTMEVNVPSNHPAPNMTCMQATNSIHHIPRSNLTANEIRLQALVDKVTAEYEALKLAITEKLNTTHGPLSVTASSTDTNTTSTLTNVSLLEALKAQQAEHQAQQETRQAQYQAQMEARFEKLMTHNIELEKKMNQQILQQAAHQSSSIDGDNEKKNSLAPDANSQAQQSDPKRQDLKATPTKSHSSTDALKNQNP